MMRSLGSSAVVVLFTVDWALVSEMGVAAFGHLGMVVRVSWCMDEE